jgi:TetR/AcrR family transcriptional regulator, tetracycline repressor protein
VANSLEDVVSGALRVLDQYGLEFCSMRRVAAELKVQPSALYHHVADKQTLLALMADRIVEDVSGDSASQLMSNLRMAMLAIRDGADVVATASAFRLGASTVEHRLADLLGDKDAARTLLLYVFGHTQATQMHRQASQAGLLPEDPELDQSFERGVALILAGVQI